MMNNWESLTSDQQDRILTLTAKHLGYLAGLEIQLRQVKDLADAELNYEIDQILEEKP